MPTTRNDDLCPVKQSYNPDSSGRGIACKNERDTWVRFYGETTVQTCAHHALQIMKNPRRWAVRIALGNQEIVVYWKRTGEN